MTKEDLFKEPLFPSLNFQSWGDSTFLVSSAIRIKNLEDGKYYRTLLLRYHKSSKPIPYEEKQHKIQQLVSDGYFMCFLGKVDLLLQTIGGDSVFYLDDNQEEESERLKSIYK